MEHVSEAQDPLDAGFDAALAGEDRDRNPWPKGSIEYQQWDAGWTAFAEDEQACA